MGKKKEGRKRRGVVIYYIHGIIKKKRELQTWITHEQGVVKGENFPTGRGKAQWVRIPRAIQSTRRNGGPGEPKAWTNKTRSWKKGG